MAIATRISNETCQRLALAEPARKWELWEGQPREKPGMTFARNETAYPLGFMPGTQLDRSAYRVRVAAGRIHRPGSTYVIRDVFAFPTTYITPRLPA